ncbi:MAG TPA: glycosyltransferase family 9 protein [Nitrospirae bacterium]|nr:glycosyltransferase family 9 protein [Nitrospirota bacterium]
MKDVLIVNLTRMGDLVQTTPVMAGLKDRYPGARITLLVSSAFLEICRYIPDADRVFVLDINKVLQGLKRRDPVGTFRYLEDIVGKINDTLYDLVINFTHSPSSAVLTSLFRTKEVRGLSMDDEGFTVKRHPWIRYFFNVIPARDYNPFHLCDMYLKAGGVTPKGQGLHLDIPPDAEQRADSILTERGVNRGDIVVGLQLGASAEDKRWPVARFAELADRLVEVFGLKILLTGSVKEVHYGKEFETIATTKPLNLIGKTDLRELAALLKRCNLFISNDTGPLHIATAVETRTINISLASVHFRETGPYGEGHYVVGAELPCSPCGFNSSCKDMVCKRVINANNVFELSKELLIEGDLTSIEDSAAWENVQVYKSFFEKDGFIDYVPLIKGRPLKKELLFAHIYRQTWLKILDREYSSTPDSIYQHFVEKLSECYDMDSVNTSILFEEELEVLRRLKELSDSAFSIIAIIDREAKKSSPDVELIKQIWKGVPPLDQEIETIGYTCPALKPLTTIFKYEKEELEEEDIAVLSEKACRIYNDLGLHASMLIQFLRSLPSIFAKQHVCVK